MSIDWGNVAKSYFDELPHPMGHGLKIKEFATAVKLATLAKFGGHAQPHEAALFWGEFAPGGKPIMSPEEFEQTLDRIAPLSFTYHGRPPTMKEITTLKDAPPHEASKYFGDLPDAQHPNLSAAQMVKSLTAARPWAREHLKREPLKNEAAYLHHSGTSPNDYYSHLAAQDPALKPRLPGNELSPEIGGDAGGRSLPTTGGPQVDNGTAHA